MTTETRAGKVIGNVGVLDLQDATEESIAEIRSIGNVGVVLYSAETAPLLTKLNLGNMGSSVQVGDEATDADIKLIIGQETFSLATAQALAEPHSFVIVGQWLVNSDVTPNAFVAAVRDISLAGQIICPDTLVGLVQSKLKSNQGHILTYPAQAILIMENLSLDEPFLHSLDDGTDLVVLGRVEATTVLPDALLTQKLQSLQVMSRLICRGENEPLLRTLLADPATKIRAIPAGFEWVAKALTLDAATLTTLPNRNLCCDRSLLFEPDVDEEAVDAHLERLIVNNWLIAPASLRQVLAKKCNLLETNTVFYQGTLWQIRSDEELTTDRFSYTEGRITLIVWGSLIIDPDVEPKLLAERFDKVHNFGEIICARPQQVALQARLGINEGEFINPGASDQAHEDSAAIGNAGYLKL